MKKFLKNNYLYFVIIFILLSIFAFNASSYIKNDINLKNSEKRIREECKIEKYESTEQQKKCDLINKTKEYKSDAYSMFYQTYVSGYNNIIFLMFIIITIPTTLSLTTYLKNNILKNDLTRKSYKNILRKLFLKSSVGALILPTLAIVTFIFSYIYTGNFDYHNAIDGSFVPWQISTIENPIIFISVYSLKLFITSLIYINISIIISRKNHSFFISLIKSYILFVGIELFLEIVLNMLISNIIFKSNFGTILNILSIFSVFDYYGILIALVIPLVFLLISYIVIYILYKNKERLLLDCEKNS